MIKPSLILIDQDVTMVDSVPNLVASLDVMMGQIGRIPQGEARVLNWVGNGAEHWYDEL